VKFMFNRLFSRGGGQERSVSEATPLSDGKVPGEDDLISRLTYLSTDTRRLSDRPAIVVELNKLYRGFDLSGEVIGGMTQVVLGLRSDPGYIRAEEPTVKSLARSVEDARVAHGIDRKPQH
jgi:hypothetical protein